MDIEKNIKDIRAKKGLMQKEVAEQMGMEKPNYNRLEKKGNKLSIEQLQKIADILGVSLKELIFNEVSTEETHLLLKKQLELEYEKSTTIYWGLLNLLRKLNTYLPTQPLQTDIGEDLQPNNYKIFLTYRCEFKGKHYTLAHWEKSISKEESFYIRNGHQENLGKRLLNKGPKTTQKEREHAAYIQDIAYQNIKTNHNLWAIYFLNIEEFFKSVFEALQ